MKMKNDLRPQKSVAQRVGSTIVALAVLWFIWLAVHDPYSKEFTPPKTFAQVTHRIEFGVRRVAGKAESSIQDTNDSMQDTVDGRNRLNDSRIQRDTP